MLPLKSNALQVSAVIAVGLVEGIQHVNWRRLATILTWWILGFAAVILATAVFVAQGKPCQSMSPDHTSDMLLG